MKRYRPTIDVSNLPTFVFGREAITWWGTVGFAAIEGMSLVVCAVAYLYLRKNVYHWPPPPTRLRPPRRRAPLPPRAERNPGRSPELR